MIPQDLSELLKQRKFSVPPGETKYLFLQVLEEANKLRGENPTAVISRVLASNMAWVSQKVRVLPAPNVKQKLEQVVIEMDENIPDSEVVIEYFLSNEVEAFSEMIDVSP